MAELATVARPYAEALFKAAQADLEATQTWLSELALIASDAQVLRLAAHPRVSAEQVFNVVAAVAKAPLGEAARNFLRTVIANRRLAALPQMAEQFRALKNAQAGTSEAVVYSAYPIDQAALADLGQVLQKRFGRPLKLSQQADATLIGGVRVVVGDEVLDTSVKARLEQMKVALAA